jgi:acyl-CoA oxidase
VADVWLIKLSNCDLVVCGCRECCGGQGFLAANKIGSMKTDMDVYVTFEGDNTVMMQQVNLK